ncbi:remorin 4.1 [Senna tora]|uniref:Remorin 4.1 n=1 Tax=Senna tora TaxID=362788 RepID=A0A834T258_9FABA|nr:remorin 4.1 [Senna tora]
MRSVEEKGCYNHQTQETPNSSAVYFEFHKGGTNRTTLGKPTPSKWDDAQKWLVGLSSISRGGGGGGAEKSQSKNKPRNSNADDLRLISPVPQKEQDCDEKDEEEEVNDNNLAQCEAAEETKKVECDESFWRINKHTAENPISVRSICVRDMGTEMTPIASQEPSRTATPIRATTPASRSPIQSGASTPLRCQNGGNSGNTRNYGAEAEESCKISEQKKMEDEARKLSPLETRAMAWDEAERAKYMARFKREEVKIQAWENHQIRKAEMEVKKIEVKAERMKARAQEKLANKVATTKRVAEEKRANAQSKLNEKALRTSEKADYIRRTGHVPSSFSFNFFNKFPSICW